jgi:hypothetical protein
MVLSNATYENDYKGGKKPKKLRLDSKYGLCFRQCLYFFILEVLKRKSKKRYPQVEFCAGSRSHQCW